MQVCKTQTIKLSFVRIVSLSAMDISSADNACGMQAGRKKAVPVAAIFDQLFQITEEDWGHSLQLPAALVKYHTSRFIIMQSHTLVMNKNQAKLAISEDKTHNS